MAFKGNDITVLDRIRKRFEKQPKRGEDPQTIAARDSQMRALRTAMDESEHVARFIEAAQSVKDADLLTEPEAETPTAEQIADMSGEELDVLLRLADESRQIGRNTQELSSALANLGSAEGWEIADDLADVVRAVVESRMRAADRWQGCLGLINAELAERRRAAAKEARKRRYLEEHQGEMLEAMITGDEERINELREALNDPPEFTEPEPSSVQTWGGFASDTVFETGESEGA